MSQKRIELTRQSIQSARDHIAAVEANPAIPDQEKRSVVAFETHYIDQLEARLERDGLK